MALIRDGFTARGDWAFSPFNNTTYAKSLFLINLGYNALALMDVINLGVLSNISRQEFLFDADRDKRYHMEKQPQFVEEVASNAFLSVNEALSRFNSPQFLLPPHQTVTGEFILILDYLGTCKEDYSWVIFTDKQESDTVKDFLDSGMTLSKYTVHGLCRETVRGWGNAYDNLNRVLESGYLPLTNNIAERAVKPFVINRKSFMTSFRIAKLAKEKRHRPFE